MEKSYMFARANMATPLRSESPREFVGTIAMLALNDMHMTGYRSGRQGHVRRCHRFDRLSIWTVRAAGCRWGFRLAVLLILAWAAAGPLFHYHESWTTIFTVATTSVMFLLVFLIQNVQNRELKAVHLKLDELIWSAKSARNELIDIEYLTEEQLERLGRRYSKLAELHQHSVKKSEGEAMPEIGEGERPLGPGLRQADAALEVLAVAVDEQSHGDSHQRREVGRRADDHAEAGGRPPGGRPVA
jgi:low affinity Fe/Cu permease